MSSVTPTREQSDIVDAFSTGEDLVVDALAGTGKTFSLDLCARTRTTPATYAAFNKAIADEAGRKFPRHVQCRTMHSLAFSAVGRDFGHRLDGPRVPSWKVAQILRIPSRWEFGTFSLRERQIASLVMETVKRFCHSIDVSPSQLHIPRVPGLDTVEARFALAQFLFPFVETAWADLQDKTGRGQLKFSHDVYLKLWAMTAPKLPGSVVFFDEAQDADPVIRQVVQGQKEFGSQLVIVGDPNQQIYAWRGAVNALDLFDVEHRLPLQSSFRFGPVVAEQANLILGKLDTDLRLEGLGAPSVLAELEHPDAVLCRTNAEAVATLMEAQVRGLRAGLVGGTTAVENLAKAAQDLMRGEKTWHPELIAFDSWSQVQTYVTENKEEARDLAVLVKLVDRHGPETLLAAVERAVPENIAELVISTAHKAKGREWGSVRVAPDFAPPVDEEGQWRADELRLAYVTVTRAQRFLDARAMDWLTVLAIRAGVHRPEEVVPAFLVPPPVTAVLAASSAPIEDAQVICDPEDPRMLVMHRTKYDPELVNAQRDLPGRRYKGEYCGMEKVNRVTATLRVLAVAQRFGLSVSPAAKQRVEEMGLA